MLSLLSPRARKGPSISPGWTALTFHTDARVGLIEVKAPSIECGNLKTLA